MIINADDFGYSAQVNEAVTECFRTGVINRTTIMVNMPGAEEAAKLARENGFFDRVGLHINLTEGKALTAECAASELCDENGYLKGTFHVPFKSRLYLSPDIRRAISAETEAQIKKFLSMGFTLRHADSHNYTHSYLSVYGQVRPLLIKHGFKSVRISRNIPKGSFSPAFTLYKGVFNFLIKLLKRKGISSTRYFGSLRDFENSADKDKIKKDLELMTHPLMTDNDLIDNTLPDPHPFITREYIEANGFVMNKL